jgi:hypothetical protein
MKKQNLTQYVFADGHEQIADKKGRIIAVRDPKFNRDYLPLNIWPKPYVQGSTLEPCSNNFSRTPKVNEYLLTARLLGFGQHISNTLIRKINEGFELPS